MTDNEKKNAYTLYLASLNELSLIRGDKPFIRNESNREQIKQVFNYAIGNTEWCDKNGISLKKSLILLGNPGSGKTMLFDAWSECLKYPEVAAVFRKFNSYTSQEVALTYEKEGVNGITKFMEGSVYHNGTVPIPVHGFFDDLGTEDMVNHYGNKKEVMEMVLTDRYDRWTKLGVMTHLTTNLTKKRIGDRYGQRVLSRISQMCNFIYLGADAGATDFRL